MLKIIVIKDFDEHIDRLTKAIDRNTEALLKQISTPVITSVTLKQTGETMITPKAVNPKAAVAGAPPIPNGIAPGGSGTFAPVYTPAINAGLQPGSQPVYSSSDPAIQAALVPAADGSSVVVNLPSTYANPEFPLTVAIVNNVGTAIQGTVSVPVIGLQTAPIVSVTLQQTA